MAPTRICHYPRRDGPLPDGARWVGRPSRWGNRVAIVASGDQYQIVINHSGQVLATVSDKAEAQRKAVAHFRAWTALQLVTSADRGKWLSDWLAPLCEARYLACACPLDQLCHVDVLVELLTEQETN